MQPRRASLTVRTVALADAAAGQPPAGRTAAERLAMVHDLTLVAWRLSGRPLGPGVRAARTVQLRPLRAESPAP